MGGILPTRPRTTCVRRSDDQSCLSTHAVGEAGGGIPWRHGGEGVAIIKRSDLRVSAEKGDEENVRMHGVYLTIT